MHVRSTSLHPLPEGGSENSPGWSAAEPWDHVANTPPPSRRDGRNLPPHVARIVFNAVFREKRDKLRLKIALPVVLLLARYVRQRRAHLSPSNGERPIAFLPFEIIHCASIVHPERGCALDLPHRRRDRHGRRQREQKMNVVLDPADAKRFHLVLVRDAAHIGPKTRLNIRYDCLAPLLGGEDAMIERRAISV